MKRLEMTGNQLKLIALMTMTADHVGYILFPQHVFLRLIGRLALPIYAYMIAEGCQHTRSMPRYLGSLALVAGVCQLVYLFAMNSLYQCILVTFSLSVSLIWLLDNARKKGTVAAWTLAGVGLAAGLFITEGLQLLLTGTDFTVDYGFVGMLLPVAVYFAKERKQKLLVCGIMLVLLTLDVGMVQGFSLLALPLLALYNRRRGEKRLKWFFYLYYPVHLVVIYLVGIFM